MLGAVEAIFNWVTNRRVGSLYRRRHWECLLSSISLDPSFGMVVGNYEYFPSVSCTCLFKSQFWQFPGPERVSQSDRNGLGTSRTVASITDLSQKILFFLTYRARFFFLLRLGLIFLYLISTCAMSVLYSVIRRGVTYVINYRNPLQLW